MSGTGPAPGPAGRPEVDPVFRATDGQKKYAPSGQSDALAPKSLRDPDASPPAKPTLRIDDHHGRRSGDLLDGRLTPHAIPDQRSISDSGPLARSAQAPARRARNPRPVHARDPAGIPLPERRHLAGRAVADDACPGPHRRTNRHLPRTSAGSKGQIVRHTEHGLALSITATLRKRDKLASQLTWLANRQSLGLPEDRRHERISPRHLAVPVKLANNREVAGRLMDISLSGAAVTLAQPPEIGAAITLGRTPGRVVRHSRAASPSSPPPAVTRSVRPEPSPRGRNGALRRPGSEEIFLRFRSP